MKFGTSEDIEAPIEHVFGAITDFSAFERAALRRGAEMQRVDSAPSPGVGMEWLLKFVFRGKPREMRLKVTEFSPPQGYVLELLSASIAGHGTLDLVALTPARTRLKVALEIEARSLTGRLMVQSLKLARGNLSRRFDLRVAEFAADVEDRYKRLHRTT